MRLALRSIGAQKPLSSLLVALACVSLLLGLAACGGGGHHHFSGTLEVVNDDFSFDFIDEIDVDEVGGPDSFAFSVFVPPGDSFFVDLFPDNYDVTIFWGDGSVEFHTVAIFDGFVTVLPVSN